MRNWKNKYEICLAVERPNFPSFEGFRHFLDSLFPNVVYGKSAFFTLKSFNVLVNFCTRLDAKGLSKESLKRRELLAKTAIPPQSQHGVIETILSTEENKSRANH